MPADFGTLAELCDSIDRSHLYAKPTAIDILPVRAQVSLDEPEVVVLIELVKEYSALTSAKRVFLPHARNSPSCCALCLLYRTVIPTLEAFARPHAWLRLTGVLCCADVCAYVRRSQLLRAQEVQPAVDHQS